MDYTEHQYYNRLSDRVRGHQQHKDLVLENELKEVRNVVEVNHLQKR